MDWTVFHALNSALVHREGAQDVAQGANAWGLIVLVAAAGVTWFFGRPGASTRPKLAAVSAAGAGGLALVMNLGLGQLWYHDRPFVDHPRRTLLLIHHGADNSFPSDHASLAFAIAFAVLFFYRRFGVLLLLAAAAVGIDRILVGVHYPVDVAMSVVVGAAAAALVTQLGRPWVEQAARLLSRVSDPVVEALALRARRLVR